MPLQHPPVPGDWQLSTSAVLHNSRGEQVLRFGRRADDTVEFTDVKTGEIFLQAKVSPDQGRDVGGYIEVATATSSGGGGHTVKGGPHETARTRSPTDVTRSAKRARSSSRPSFASMTSKIA